MTITSSSLRFASLAAALSAITTFLLWLLPQLYQPPGDFSQTIALHHNSLYLARLWVNFVHIFAAITGYAAVACLLWHRSALLASLGFVWLVLGGLTELIGVSTNLIAVNATWRAGFTAATPAAQEQLRILLLGFAGVWDALFFLLLVCFTLGSLFLGLIAMRGKRLERAVGILFLLAVPLTLVIIIGGYTRFEWVATPVNYVYPILQPVARAALAVWLWQRANVAVNR